MKLELPTGHPGEVTWEGGWIKLELKHGVWRLRLGSHVCVDDVEDHASGHGCDRRRGKQSTAKREGKRTGGGRSWLRLSPGAPWHLEKYWRTEKESHWGSPSHEASEASLVRCSKARTEMWTFALAMGSSCCRTKWWKWNHGERRGEDQGQQRPRTFTTNGPLRRSYGMFAV